MSIRPGACVKIPDGRIGRVRNRKHGQWRVRVKRTTSDTHKFLYFDTDELRIIDCPKGWMSVQGYNSYVRQTLNKMKTRLKMY